MDFADAHGGIHGVCGCCGHTASAALLDEMSIMQLERAIIDYTGLVDVRRAEDADAPYVPAEVNLTELLASHADTIADDVEAPILDALSGDYVDADRILSATGAAASIWAAEAWPTSLEAKVGYTVNGAALMGSNAVPFSPTLGDVDRLRIVNGMVRSAKYTTNNYFNTQVMPALIDAANAAVLNGRGNDAEELQAIRQLLDRRLRSVPYWNVVANAAASRAYHFGYIKAGVAKGWDTVQYVAVIDGATSEMCRNLNGTQWRSADVSLLADRIADAQTVEDVKAITPWLKPREITDWSPEALLSMGVVIPPVHGRCRSKLAFV